MHGFAPFSDAVAQAVMPQLEGEERPQCLAVILPPLLMFIDEARDRLGLEDALRSETWSAQHIRQQFAKLAPEPPGHRDPKAFLRPAYNVGRKSIARDPPEQILADASPELQVRG